MLRKESVSRKWPEKFKGVLCELLLRCLISGHNDFDFFSAKKSGFSCVGIKAATAILGLMNSPKMVSILAQFGERCVELFLAGSNAKHPSNST